MTEQPLPDIITVIDGRRVRITDRALVTSVRFITDAQGRVTHEPYSYIASRIERIGAGEGAEP